jgi:hypothetical protein
METAKVDVRKLQLLNDRINQCLDALNQVRLSVHGLSHTQASSPIGPIVPGTGYIDPRFSDPRFGYGMTPGVQNFGGTQGFPTPGFAGGQGYGGGLAHSPFLPPSVGAFNQLNPLQATGGLQPGNPFPIWNLPVGLSHTGLEAESGYNRPLWADPMLAAKVAQTFPFVQYGLPPLVPVY